MTDFRIPFNRVAPAGRELEYVGRAIERRHISGSGPFTRDCEALLERALGVPRVLLTTSCTHALEMCALLLDIAPGDEVILPSFTFVSTANAFALRGARPVFVDVRDDTLNLDERLLAAAITPRTRAIVVVHYAGVACDMDAILPIAAARRIAVVEDNAHGLFGSYRGRLLGTFGPLASLSFHETKNVSCGEGGALVLSDPALIERAEVIREKGTNRARFLRGEVDKYTWTDIGSSYVPSDLLAAFLYGQLERADDIQRFRRSVFDRYDEALGSWARSHGFRTLTAPDGCSHPSHMYYLRLPGPEVRERFIRALAADGILAVSHYVPLHLSPVGRRYGYQPGDLPVTERASGEIVRLPFFTSLDERDQREVIGRILSMDPAADAAVGPAHVPEADGSARHR
jgi:dTDP-4-amino-4,6-dideoxygalactose transaminase